MSLNHYYFIVSYINIKRMSFVFNLFFTHAISSKVSYFSQLPI